MLATTTTANLRFFPLFPPASSTLSPTRTTSALPRPSLFDHFLVEISSREGAGPQRFAASLMDCSTIKCPKTDHRAVFESSQSRCGPSLNISSDYDQYVWPWRGIILNASNLLGQKQGTKLENEIKEQLNRFHTKGVHVLWDYQKFSGHAVVEFDGDWTGFADAMLFENAFSLVASDKWKWKEPKNHQAGLYGWVARADDYNDDGILGQYLRKNGVLKRISDMKSEWKKKFVALTKEIDYKNWRFLDLESKYSCISREKDALNLAYAKEQGKTLHLINEIEKLKQELESQRMESEQSRKKEQGKTLHLIKEIEKLKQELESQRMESEQSQEKEQGKTLHLIKENEKLKQELESQRQESEQLESEKKKVILERRKVRRKLRLMEGNLEMPQCRVGDNEGKEMHCLDGDIDREEICCLLKNLEERENENKNLEELNQTLTVRDRLSNNELQEARKEFINVLKDLRRGRGSIGVKRLGVVDEQPFKDACRQKYPPGEANFRAAEMCSSWQEIVNNASWHPFKMTTFDGKLHEIIDDTDENLKGLKEEWGDGIYMAVATALLELNEYNSSGRYAIQELWNFTEKRKATLKEAIQCVSKKLKNKRVQVGLITTTQRASTSGSELPRVWEMTVDPSNLEKALRLYAVLKTL